MTRTVEPRPKTPRGRTRGVTPSGFFAFRTPLLPVEELLALSEGAQAPGAAPAELEAALRADRARTRARMRALIERPEVREAIFVASPSLDESIGIWMTQPESERGLKVERTLTRYVARMAGRSTPFGLFAGCSVGTLGPETHITVAERARYERHTRLDMDYVCALTGKLGRAPELRRVLIHRPNSSLYHSAGRLRYAEARLEGGDGRTRSYHLVALDSTPYLEATLARAQGGARPHALAQALADDDPEVSLEEAEGYVNELIDNQVLVADLEPAVTGPEPIHGLVAALGELGEVGAPAAALLAETRDAIDAIDRAGVGGDSARYHAIAKRLEVLPAPVELPRLFQIDMVKPAPDATLGTAVVDEMIRALELLHRCVGGGDNESLRSFRERYSARYESRELPLADVLDEESGIGYERSDAPGAEASPLLEGMVFGGAPREGSVPWSAREVLLLGKLLDCERTGAQQIELGEEDWKVLERPAESRAPLPDSFAVMGEVLAASPEAVAAGDFKLHFHGSPSGAALLGRFCHADPVLEKHVRDHLRAEEAFRPGAIFAEIVHLPEGRIGNVIARPVLREHEIVYLGRSGAPDDKQLAITDLMVSIQGRRVVLRSKRLGVEVIPRLTNAHNTGHPRNLSLYKFLAAVQRQGTTGVGWSWGSLDGARFLPRVTSGKLVLALARWRVPRQKLEKLGVGTDSARWQAVQDLRRELRLPRWVAVADGDNELPIDLDNVLSVDTLVALVKDRGEATLEEILPFDETLVARGPEGRFVHELVVPFTRVAEPTPARPLPVTATAARSFGPASEWLYAKLYCGPATADGVLRDVIAPVVAAGGFERWFFIRYGDPDWHLRVRFQGDPATLHGPVLAALRAAVAPLLEDGRVWKMQLDTYERETERYGGPAAMELSEQLFAGDSDACLAIVETLAGDEGADARWRLALRGTDLLLEDLGLDVAARLALMKRTRASFAQEFGGGAGLDKQLGDKFRKLRPELEALLVAGPEDDWLGPGIAAFARRSEALRPIVAALRAAPLTGTLDDLAGSYVHMHVNRLARSAARAQELLLYDFLSRLYESRLKRKPATT